ncbi:Na(+)/citrate cotransporter-like isoform X2 [Helicoverpa armigera]|uniref:Na(+)/citrate cotransporter-like isoform X2 n=1 Tax=Helicoverpa armigera TaxID=29058 RepID=UPI0030829A1D
MGLGKAKKPPPPPPPSTLGSLIPNPFRSKEPPKTPVPGMGFRIKNMFKNNFRGIIGSLVPLCLLSWQSERDNHALTVQLTWLLMFWFFLVQPVAVPATGLITVFLLPMAGVISSIQACNCYMNENIILFLLSSMLILLLNNSGVDRRIAIWFICSGDACQYSAKRIIFKFSSAAFFLSMLSNRLIICSTLTQISTSVLTKLDASTLKSDEIPNFVTMRYIVNNAIQVSAGIGSTAIMHSASVTMLFRAIFVEFAPKGQEYPDIFNYLQYSAFAFPVAFLMFIFCLIYHMLLSNSALKVPMPSGKMEELRAGFLRFQEELPSKHSLHEKLSVIFLIVTLCMFFFRWCKWIEGWADFSATEGAPQLPRVKDATVAAIFVIFLHTLPKSYSFLKFLNIERKSELPPLKPESAVLWWRFVDRNVNYAYYFVFGSALSITIAAEKTGLHRIIGENLGKIITGKSWNVGLFLTLFLITFLANIMSAVPACTVFLPFVLCASVDAAQPWPGKVYVAALGVGIASSFGFSCPFLYTPAYFCHYTGKVPILKMAKYSFIPVWICLVTLFVALMIWAPFVFDSDDAGVMAIPVPGGPGETTTVTEAAPGGL